MLRIEDTDRKRLVVGAETELMDGLRWLGLTWDEGTDIGGAYGLYRQSERKKLYQQYARQLIESDHAFYCFCSSEQLEKVRNQQQKDKMIPHYDGTCRNLAKEKALKRVAKLDGAPEIAGFFFPPSVIPSVEDLIAIGLTAGQSADAALRSLSVLETAAEMTPEAAEAPMRALMEELGLCQPVRYSAFCVQL